jgi:hypothetical protein
MDIIFNWQSKLFMKAIAFPILITFSSLIPGLNREFFTHAGLGWFLLGFSLPWVIGVMIVDIKRNFKADFKNHIIYGIVFLILYLILSYPLTILFQKGMMTIGYSMELKEAWKFYLVPFSLFY